MKEIQKIKAFLNTEGIKPNKRLGQNFLINRYLAEKIAGIVKKFPPPYIEIGPGTGALTRFFNKEDLFLIEKDKKLAFYWIKKGFVTHHTDVLKSDFNRFLPSSTLFGNLPYNLAGPLIIKSSLCNNISQMIFMIQKEVASRVRGKPATKDYGLLSVISPVFWKISPIEEAKPGDFYPVPKVSGKILKFIRNPVILPEISKDPEPFIKFIKCCFSNRRKKLVKQFSSSYSQKINLFLEKSDRSLNTRAEELPPKEFIRLYLFLSSNDPDPV